MTVPELQRLRLMPLNQVAAIKLREAQAQSDHDTLPVLQLMVWGLTNGIRPQRRAAQELLRLRYLADQGSAFRYFLERVGASLPNLPREILPKPPREAAEHLLNVLDRYLTAGPPNPAPSGAKRRQS